MVRITYSRAPKTELTRYSSLEFPHKLIFPENNPFTNSRITGLINLKKRSVDGTKLSNFRYVLKSTRPSYLKNPKQRHLARNTTIDRRQTRQRLGYGTIYQNKKQVEQLFESRYPAGLLQICTCYAMLEY